MRAGLVLVAAALLTAGCAGGTQMPRRVYDLGASQTRLTIVVWPRGTSSRSRAWTLRCPAGGTLPQPARSCRRLRKLEANPFAPVPPDVACTQLYGGPQVAEVRGTFNGRRVVAALNRTNGCEITRWDRLRFLFPIGT